MAFAVRIDATATSLTGAEAGLYYVDSGRPALATYHLDAGEPPGAWVGKQAQSWALVGDVDPEVFLSLMDGADPSGAPLGRGYGDESVRGYDNVLGAEVRLHAVGGRRRAGGGGALAAHDTAVRTVLDRQSIATAAPTSGGGPDR